MKQGVKLFLKILATLLVLLGSFYLGFIVLLLISFSYFDNIFSQILLISIPIFILASIWKFSKKILKIFLLISVPALLIPSTKAKMLKCKIEE